MKNRIEYIIFIIFSSIFRTIGLHHSRRLGKLIGIIFYYFIPIRKSTVISNLSSAFPEKSANEIRKITKGVYISFAISLAEILLVPSLRAEEMAKLVEIKNLEGVRKRYEEGRGVILLSAHFGNWEYMALSTGVQLNLPISSIVKPQRNKYVNEFMNSIRTQYGNKIVPLGVTVRQIYKELREKRIAAMIADQRGPIEGLRIEFMGRPAAVYGGPAMLSLKTGAPILIGIAVRQPDLSYKAVMHEIDRSNLPDGDEEKIAELSKRHTLYLEGIIRENPEQWLWMHKRWKY